MKSEFRRLNLQLKFNPTEAEPRPYYIVKGRCDLSALVLFYLRSRRSSAVLDLMREESEPSTRWAVQSFRKTRRLQDIPLRAPLLTCAMHVSGRIAMRPEQIGAVVLVTRRGHHRIKTPPLDHDAHARATSRSSFSCSDFTHGR